MAKVVAGDAEAGGGSSWPSVLELEALMGEREMAALEALVKAKGGSGGVAGLMAILGTPSSGLDGSDVVQRRAFFGKNAFDAKPPTTYFERWWDAMHDGAIIVLSIMAALTILVWIFVEGVNCNKTGWMEPTALMFSINAITHTTAIIDYKKERMFAALTAQLDASNKKFVLRGGESLELADADIVVGDVMDEAALNGEPEPAEKTVEGAPFILSGTICCSGSGKLLVTAVGTHSVSGKIKAAVYGDDGDDDGGSPLFDKLDAMSVRIGKAGMFVSVLVFCVMFVLGILVNGSGARDVIHYAVQSITILAVAVPEGLPLAVTLSLAFSSSKMMSDNNLVKALKACETMGSATTICSDKTGTLTANRMTVRGACVAGCVLPAIDPRSGDADAAKPVGARILDAAQIPAALAAELGTLVAVCTMDESSVAPPEVAGGQAVFKGNPTECALLELAAGLGCDWRVVRESTAGRSEATRGEGHAFMFSSARKVMAWAVPRGDGFRVYVKGAAEIVLARCEAAATAEGSEPLDDERKERFYVQGVVKDFASDAMRTIALAYKDMPKPDAWEATSAATKNADGTDAYAAETGLTLLAVVGIEDPLRDEVPPAIARCYKAGIDVRMCTGDNLATAVAIASRCGILRDHHYVNMKASGDVTKLLPDRAMTGREIAKDAADIILLDDNFASIVTAAKWGRNVYDSICKFLQFQLTVNIAAICVAVVGAFRYQESPIAAVQMLWINLIMDSLASLALATEPPEESLLDKPPVNRSDSIISEQMWYNMFGHAAYQIVVMMLLYFDQGAALLRCEPAHRPHHGGCGGADFSKHHSALFNCFVMMTLFNEINCRKLHGETNVFEGVLKNPYFCSIWGVTMLIQVVGVQCAGGLLAVHKDGITSWQWVVCILFGAGELLWQKVINFVLRITKERAAEGPSAFREAGLLKFGSGKIALHGSVRDNTRSITSSQRSARSPSSRRRRQQKYAAQPSGGSEKSLST
ncbi:calcium-transporting ATPase [Aureococcus anophagefferens]|nr:calcium-transporting ATPase [Aureococcus anophagefferens]